MEQSCNKINKLYFKNMREAKTKVILYIRAQSETCVRCPPDGLSLCPNMVHVNRRLRFKSITCFCVSSAVIKLILARCILDKYSTGDVLFSQKRGVPISFQLSLYHTFCVKHSSKEMKNHIINLSIADFAQRLLKD